VVFLGKLTWGNRRKAVLPKHLNSAKFEGFGHGSAETHEKECVEAKKSSFHWKKFL
jgi:hypothetical protein